MCKSAFLHIFLAWIILIVNACEASSQVSPGASNSHKIDSGAESKIRFLYPNSVEQDQSQSGRGESVKDLLTLLSPDHSAVMVFRAEEKPYYFSTNIDLPENLRIMVESGAILSSGGSASKLTIHGPFEADKSRIFDWPLPGKVIFRAGGEQRVHPAWWRRSFDTWEYALQAAIDASMDSGGVVWVSPGVHEVRVVGNFEMAGGKRGYSVKLKSGTRIEGAGCIDNESECPTIKLANEQVEREDSWDAWVFASELALENVTFRGFHIDLNGENNILEPDAWRANVPAIGISGDNAKVDHLLIKDMIFTNAPGASVVIIGQSNSKSSILSEDITITSCQFRNVATSPVVTDHSSLYTWANNVLITENLFENLPETNGTLNASGFELHGTNNIFKNNVIKRFKRGGYVSSNYSEPARGQLVTYNLMEEISSFGIHVFHADGGGGTILAESLSNLTISSNKITFSGGGCAEKSRIGVAVMPLKSVSNITVTDNEFRGGVVPGDCPSEGVLVTTPETTDIVITKNLFNNLTTSIYLQGKGGETAEVSNNSILNGIDFVSDYSILSSGVAITGSLHAVSIVGNDIISTSGEMKYGLFLSGKVKNLTYGSNSFRGLSKEKIYEHGLVTEKLGRIYRDRN